MSAFKCTAIVKTGKNKGDRCCNYIKKGDFCGIHKRSPVYHPYNTSTYTPYRKMCVQENFADQITYLVIMYYARARSMVDPGRWPEDLSEEHGTLRIMYNQAFGHRVWYAIRKIQRAYREHLARKRMKMIQLVLVPIIVRNK